LSDERIRRVVNWARTVTLLGLAIVVALFVATWLTIPSGRFETMNLTTGRWETPRVDYPARLFRTGIVARDEYGAGVLREVDLRTLRQHVAIFYGGLAVVIVLIGLAFGALRRKPPPPRAYVAIPPSAPGSA
jgi:hypothetical protein